MSLEEFCATIENKLQKDFTKNTKGIKYQLKTVLNSGKILKTGERKDDMFIIVEENGENRILASFSLEQDICRFHIFSYGGICIDFGKSDDLLLYKRGKSLHAISTLYNKVEFYEEEDGTLKYDYYTENSSGRGLL